MLGKIIKNNWVLILILIVGFFLRIYESKSLFLYGHDQDLQAWIIKDLLVNKHLRLIGQETSTQGIFIGAFFYYLLIPFYLIFGMDPIGGVALVTIIGVFTIWSFYFVFLKVFEKRTGLVAALIYAISFYTIFNDREVVPTEPVIIWTVWFFYGLYLILQGRSKKGFILLGILIGLIWHLNFALVLPIPLILITVYLSKKKVDRKSLIYGILALIIVSSPLLLFEIRYGFIQTKAILLSLTTNQHDIVSGFDKFKKIIYLASKNLVGVYLGSLGGVRYEVFGLISLIVFLLLKIKKIISDKWFYIFALWILVYILFFSLYSKIVSEYYLNGMVLTYIVVYSILISYLLGKKKFRSYGIATLALFAIFNIHRFFSININKSGYIERKMIAAEINADALKMGYPCVSVSYITDPGYQLGYRYFFWLEKMHVNQPNSGSPVYTIVFPLNDNLFPVNKTFGALGLIYPDYARYTNEKVKDSCSGENSNLTDPMFGFTQ
jgi:4-amino-4-deoxy-L-arabinose transferase-like glycosyltransferase